MRIAFILPRYPRHPNGGCRIIYHYADLFCRHGHRVTIYYSANNGINSKGIPFKLCLAMRKLTPYIFKWHRLDRDIKVKTVNDINDTYIDKQDALFATTCSTARCVNELNRSNNVNKYYLIQGFENWEFTDEEVYETYNYDFTNIVVSKFLFNIVTKHSDRHTVYIPNGISFEELDIDVPVEERNPKSIAFLYHPSEIKGAKQTVEVLTRIKKKYKDLTVQAFGTAKWPKEYPEWIHYTRNADRKKVREIFNSAAICICSSIQEGFGLSGAEAMACGCALASTNYEGVLDYARDGENALLCDVFDLEKMEKNVLSLIEDNSLRIGIAQRGNRDIKKLDWAESDSKMLRLLNS